MTSAEHAVEVAEGIAGIANEAKTIAQNA